MHALTRFLEEDSESSIVMQLKLGFWFWIVKCCAKHSHQAYQANGSHAHQEHFNRQLEIEFGGIFGVFASVLILSTSM